MIGLENSYYPFDRTTKANCNLVTRVFPRLKLFFLFPSMHSHWLTIMLTFVLNACCDYKCFGISKSDCLKVFGIHPLRKNISKGSKMKIKARYLNCRIKIWTHKRNFSLSVESNSEMPSALWLVQKTRVPISTNLIQNLRPKRFGQRSLTFSCTLGSLFVFNLSSRESLLTLILTLIGRFDYFGSGVRTLNRNAFYSLGT